MNRYFYSFLVTLLLYASIIGLILNNYNNIIIHKRKIIVIHKFRIIKQNTDSKNHKIKPVLVQKKIPDVIKRRIIHKETIKPKPKIINHKIKPVLVQKKIPDVIKRRIIHKETIKPKPKIINHKIKPVLVQKKIINYALNIKRKIFITNLKRTISKNKYYPKKAIKRHIQDNVKIKFSITKNGNVSNLIILSGKTIFHKAAKQSISESFPIKIDTNLFNFPKIFTITLSFRLK